MTKDDIIRMAREAGMIGTGGAANELERLCREAIFDALPRFAALVAAAEREECAKICEIPWQGHPYDIAKQIRARGNN